MPTDITAKLDEYLKQPGAVRHDGGPCPVEEGTPCRLMFADGTTGLVGPIYVQRFEWAHEGCPLDIIAYKPEPTT